MDVNFFGCGDDCSAASHRQHVRAGRQEPAILPSGATRLFTFICLFLQFPRLHAVLATKMSTTTTTTQTITADNVLTLFPDVDTSLARSVLPTSVSSSAARDGGELEGYDEEQIRLMDEVCIVLDENDKPIGSASKKTCKLIFLLSSISDKRGTLHSLKQKRPLLVYLKG